MECNIATFKDALPLLSVIVGGVLTFLGGVVGTYLLEKRKSKNERRNLTLAFYGEIHAIDSIVRKRRYIDDLKQIIERLKKDRQFCVLNIPVQREYFRVYNENVRNIGILDSILARQIAQFYTQANSVLEDLREMRGTNPATREIDGLISWHQNLLELFEDTLRLFHSILERIAADYNIKKDYE